MLKQVFFLFFIRPMILLIAGIYVKGKENLPTEGPYIMIANHNSHLDTFVLMSLFSSTKIKKIRPVAAADYFLKNKWFRWFFLIVIGVIPISRQPKKTSIHPFSKVEAALNQGEIIIIFPEGSRGEMDEISSFQTGIAHLAKRFPDIPIIPVYLQGTGKCLPKGESLFVPFIIDVHISGAQKLRENESNKNFTIRLENKIKSLKGEL